MIYNATLYCWAVTCVQVKREWRTHSSEWPGGCWDRPWQGEGSCVLLALVPPQAVQYRNLHHLNELKAWLLLHARPGCETLICLTRHSLIFVQTQPQLEAERGDYSQLLLLTAPVHTGPFSAPGVTSQSCFWKSRLNPTLCAICFQ